MIWYDHIWSYVIIYDQIWSCMIISHHISSLMIIYDHNIKSYMIMYDRIWSYMIAYDHIWSYMLRYNHTYDQIWSYTITYDHRFWPTPLSPPPLPPWWRCPPQRINHILYQGMLLSMAWSHLTTYMTSAICGVQLLNLASMVPKVLLLKSYVVLAFALRGPPTQLEAWRPESWRPGCLGDRFGVPGGSWRVSRGSPRSLGGTWTFLGAPWAVLGCSGYPELPVEVLGSLGGFPKVWTL